MKKILILLVSLISISALSQADVTLNFSYAGKPVCNYEITIKHGDAAIGKGTTDSEGNVTFSNVMLLSKDIDVYGKKDINGGEKTFNAKGYFTLDDNNHADIHMDEFAKMVAKDAGGMMPESFFIDSWGLNSMDCH